MKDRSQYPAPILLAAFATLAIVPAPLRAWGGKGHEIQARVAVATLPAEMPPFFRESSEELAFLITEPDRWRTSEQPALTETTGVNHTFKYELAPRPLPRNRHLYLIEMAKHAAFDPKPGAGYRDFGTSPYGIQEWTEMLTAAFRRWRAMPETTPAEIARKRMHEKSILFMAGVLGHWVTDSSQPMHASIHVHGWHPSAPNPKGYVGKDLHRRFETTYVDRAIELADVMPLVSQKPRLLGDWLREAETYLAATNSHVEQVYIWDLQAPFGEGKEPAAAKPFTAARLADGARMLRDVWHSAWVRSGTPVPKFEANAAAR
ncbi:MAG: hypothetical protein EXS37_03170 [Opitutus sp.]|nr:hypothetical protein [Opitutus sp.]